MSCTEIRPMLSAYYDGETTPEEHLQVERHLAGCDRCRHTLAEYRAIGGGIRALPVPIPPTGLRREVWRAIEARQGSSRAGVQPQGGGKITPINTKQREHKTVPAFNRMAGGWGKVLRAAPLLAAMAIVLVVAFVLSNRRPATAATLQEQSPIADYGQALHVQFNRSVVKEDAERHTSVRRWEGDVPYALTAPTDMTKVYDPSRRVLTILPKSSWEAGARYDVYVDAPKIRTGVSTQTLAGSPFSLAFDTVAYTPTPTHTATPTPTDEPEPTATPTSEPTRVAQSSPTPVSGAATAVEPSSTPTLEATVTDTPRPKPSDTRVPNTGTPTALPSNTRIPTATAIVEPSGTPTTAPPKGTPTATAPPKGTAPATLMPTPRATGTPGVTATPPPPCATMPVNGFGKLWREDSVVRSRLGCPTAYEIAIRPAAEQHFQGGYMFWRGDTHTIYVFIGTEDHGNWYAFEDTWTDGDPTPNSVGTPPTRMYVPVRGFGKIWHDYPALRQALGWATDEETGVTAAWQPYARGNALWTSQRVIRILYDDTTWASYPDTYATPTPDDQ